MRSRPLRAAQPLDPPGFPVKFVLSAIAVIADAGALAAVFVLDFPLIFKLAIGIPLAVVPAGAIIFYGGRRWEWQRLHRRVEALEAEVGELRGAGPAAARVRRAA